MHAFDYQKVFTLKEAFDACSDSKDSSVFMAGGTDILVKIKKGALRPLRVIDMKGIPEMEGFSISEDRFSIGALTRIRTLETSPEVVAKLPLLAQAAGRLGSVQVRNRATLGGNLCNAAPSAETAPALLALDASAEIYGREGARVVDLSEFFTGPGTTVLKRGEILTSLTIPLKYPKRQGAVYYNLTNRKAMDIAFVGVAVLLEIGRDDRISKARIALGAVAPTPVRARSAEKVLEGKVPDEDTVLQAAERAAESCSPISDLRASAEYRRAMVNRLCQRGLLEAYGRAKNLKGGGI
ncbi:MAG: xanthine dehydrogenase family protein subunit M [Pseudomonadota bacterium]